MNVRKSRNVSAHGCETLLVMFLSPLSAKLGGSLETSSLFGLQAAVERVDSRSHRPRTRADGQRRSTRWLLGAPNGRKVRRARVGPRIRRPRKSQSTSRVFCF